MKTSIVCLFVPAVVHNHLSSLSFCVFRIVGSFWWNGVPPPDFFHLRASISDKLVLIVSFLFSLFDSDEAVVFCGAKRQGKGDTENLKAMISSKCSSPPSIEFYCTMYVCVAFAALSRERSLFVCVCFFVLTIKSRHT